MKEPDWAEDAKSVAKDFIKDFHKKIAKISFKYNDQDVHVMQVHSIFIFYVLLWHLDVVKKMRDKALRDKNMKIYFLIGSLNASLKKDLDNIFEEILSSYGPLWFFKALRSISIFIIGAVTAILMQKYLL